MKTQRKMLVLYMMMFPIVFYFFFRLLDSTMKMINGTFMFEYLIQYAILAMSIAGGVLAIVLTSSRRAKKDDKETQSSDR